MVAINSIENQADDIFDMSIEKLFETEPDAKEVIKKREIYQVMEIVTDKCEDAANVIESIIIKYAWLAEELIGEPANLSWPFLLRLSF